MERLDGKLFERLSENEFSQISNLVGGLKVSSTCQNGCSDTLYEYETWNATNGDGGTGKDNLRTDDSTTVFNGPCGTIPIDDGNDYTAFTITESFPDVNS